MAGQPTLPSIPSADRYNKAFAYGFFLQIPTGTPNVSTGASDMRARQTSELQANTLSADDDDVEYVELNLSPQFITMREPVATQVSFMQGGGKYVESRGGLVKIVQIRGTTGFVPKSPGAVPTTENRAERSGFRAFYKLRHLFRRFMHFRRIGVQVQLHYLDYKGDDYWLIEPTEFQLTRNSKRPFLYDYSIAFQCLEPSSGFTGTEEESVADVFVSDQPGVYNKKAPEITKALTKLERTRKPGFAYVSVLGSGTSIGLKYQSYLRKLGEVTQFFTDAKSALFSIPKTFNNLVRQTSNFLDGVFSAMNLDGSASAELNDVLLESKFVLNYLGATILRAAEASDILDAVNTFNVPRATSGFANDQHENSSGDTGENPFLGNVSVGDVIDVASVAAGGYRAVPVTSGESIYDIARRVYGDPNRFIDIVLANNLQFPYIVADANNKLPDTIAWGEYIRVPSSPSGESASSAVATVTPHSTHTGTISRAGTGTEIVDEDNAAVWEVNQWVGFAVTLPDVTDTPQRVVISNTATTLVVSRAWDTIPPAGTVYTLTLTAFSVSRPVSVADAVYGRDLFLGFLKTSGVSSSPALADIMLNSRGDIAMVAGRENLVQAMTLLLFTEQGRHPFHPTYGVGVPIGRPWSQDQALLYTFFIRQSLLGDARIARIQNLQTSYASGTLYVQAEVTPAKANNSQLFTVSI